MLTLLRRHQKVIFTVVAVMVIASFCFFGTYGTIGQVNEEPDFLVGTALDGSPMMHKQIAQLVRFLETDVQDSPIVENRGYANFLNDGVIKNDIFQCGIGKVLYERYEANLKGELEDRLARFIKFRPYVHPQKVFGMEMTWKRFMPVFFDHYTAFREGGAKASSETFLNLVTLYMDQVKFPPSLMRQMLRYQEQQYGSMISHDSYVQTGDLSLFHASSVSDWFGPKFVELVAQFIHNGAIFAEQQGYKVSYAEAKASLIQGGMANLQRLSPNEKISPDLFQEAYRRQLRMLGMNEKEAVRAWQKILLVRRMLDDVGYGLFVDSLVYEQFHNYASRGVKVELYHLPPVLQMTNIEELIKFDLYLNAVAEKGDSLDLPVTYKSVEEVMAEAPELVEKRFIVTVAKAKRDELERDISLRETWNWEVGDQNWRLLQTQFSEVGLAHCENRQERLQFLNRLVGNTREQIDGFAREQILLEHPEMIQEHLSRQDGSLKEIRIAMKGIGEPIPGLSDRMKLLDSLEKASLNEGASGPLSCYTEDGDTYYRIGLVDRSPSFEVMSFEEAVRSGALDLVLDTRLESEYAKRGYKEPFEEVRLNIAKKLFARFASDVVREEREYDPAVIAEEDAWQVAKERRLGMFMREARKKVVAGDEGAVVGLLQNESRTSSDRRRLAEKLPNEKQWRLVCDEVTLDRKGAHPLFHEGLFSASDGDWSDVIFGVEPSPVFYQVIEKVVDAEPIQQGMKEGRALLGSEARGQLVKKLVDSMEEKGAIVFAIKPISDEERELDGDSRAAAN